MIVRIDVQETVTRERSYEIEVPDNLSEADMWDAAEAAHNRGEGELVDESSLPSDGWKITNLEEI
jgi:hypothetical protein